MDGRSEYDGIETVLVVGSFAGNLEKSLDVKRDAEGIAATVVAADIGRLLPVDVTEALQRVLGTTNVREAGEG